MLGGYIQIKYLKVLRLENIYQLVLFIKLLNKIFLMIENFNVICNFYRILHDKR